MQSLTMAIDYASCKGQTGGRDWQGEDSLHEMAFGESE